MKLIPKLFLAFAWSLIATGFGKDHDDNGRANHFDWINLVSDINGVARHTDANLANPWGLVIAPTGAIWVADNATGVATVYDSHGRVLPSEASPLIVTIPAAPGSTEGGKPTGQVFNATPNFVISQGGHSGKALFLFSSESGTISGWNPSVDPTNAVLMVNHSAQEAIYKGLAIASSNGNSFLYATDFHGGTVQIFDKNFAPVVIPGAFHDPNIPAGFAPFGIQNIRNQIFVTFAKQDADAEDDVSGPGNGFVDVFDLNGALIRRFASQGTLNSPWAVVRAPQKPGKFGNALLVGNFGDGRINAYDFATGAFLGQLKNSHGDPLAFDGLWGLAFAGDELFFTAGIADEEHGLFGVINKVRIHHDKDNDNDEDNDDQGDDNDDQGENED